MGISYDRYIERGRLSISLIQELQDLMIVQISQLREPNPIERIINSRLPFSNSVHLFIPGI